MRKDSEKNAVLQKVQALDAHDKVLELRAQKQIRESSVPHMQNKITYVRSENGRFVKVTAAAVKKSFEITLDVVRAYATLINVLLTLALKVGLICFLYPYIARFMMMFIKAVEASSDGLMM